MRRLLPAALLLSALLLPARAGAAGEDDEAPVISLSEWSVVRTRYGQGDRIPRKVEASVKVTNNGERQINQLRSKVAYFDSTGAKVKESTLQYAMFIAPGKSHVFQYIEGLVPAFEAYELTFEYELDGRKYRYLYRSPDPVSLPTLWSDRPVKGASQLEIMGREVSGDDKRGRKLYLRLRNRGDRPATGAKVVVEFTGEHGRTVGTWEKQLGDGVVPGGAEKVYEYPIDGKTGAYNSYLVKLVTAPQDQEAQLPPGSFTSAEEIELAEFKFSRKDGNVLHIEAGVRNGTKKQVAGPMVVIRLTDRSTPPKVVKEIPFEVPGALEPGQVRPVALTVPDCPPFGAYTYEVNYAERTEPVFKPVTATVAKGKVGVTRVDVERLDDGTLRFKAAVLSRAPHEVTGLQVAFVLYGGAGGAEVGRCAGALDRLAAGASGTVLGELVKPPEFATFNYKVTYTEPTPPPGGGKQEGGQ